MEKISHANGGSVAEYSPPSAENSLVGEQDSSERTDPEVRRKLKILGDRRELDLSDQILLGSPDAEFVVVKLFDYSCHHCRQLHFQFEEARRRYGDQLSIVLVPVPLNSGCNPAIKETYPRHSYACLYARLALAVWKHKRESFPEFHAWLFASEDPPEPGTAKREARRLIGNQIIAATIDDPWVEGHLKACVQLYDECGRGGIPKLLLGPAVAKGNAESADELCGILEKHLGIKAPQTAGR
jgi:hypothetical protein